MSTRAMSKVPGRASASQPPARVPAVGDPLPARLEEPDQPRADPRRPRRGTSTLRGCLDSEDTRAMLAAIARFGLALRRSPTTRTTVTLTGGAGPPNAARRPRAADRRRHRRHRRPLPHRRARRRPAHHPRRRQPAHARAPDGGPAPALREQGATIAASAHDDLLPIEIHGARLRGGEIRLPRPPSSQFISALILAAALAERPTRIVLEQGTPARPYVDMTLVALRDFGGDAAGQRRRDHRHHPAPLRARDYTVEPDASAASYLLALPAIFGGSVTVADIGSDSVQGDAEFCEVLARMGAHVSAPPTSTTVTGTGELRGVVPRPQPHARHDADRRRPGPARPRPHDDLTASRSSATTRATASPPQPPSSASSAPPSRSSPTA
jgi:3-phosphoshikimate 1-carboxyvinyltransferase